MPVEIITTDDLREFKIDLINEIKKILQHQDDSKKWLKSADVTRLLNISSGTLQTLRMNGTIPYTKIGNLLFYNKDDIDRLIKSNGHNICP